MNYISLENVSKYFGERLLFEGLNFHLNQGDKVALVAKNGTGKTTLLNLITGLEAPTEGKAWLHPKISWAYLSQDPDLPLEATVFEAVYQSKNPLMQAIARYEASLISGEEKAMQEAMAEMDRLQAWDYEVQVKQILSRLQVDHLKQPLRQLSGGQRKRVALAKILIDSPDLLILDEPTNHLDLDMIEWLEAYLKQHNSTLLLVSHDRYFLDGVCTQIVELDQGGLFKYQGDYAYYLIQKAERQAMDQASLEKARNLYRKELDWMRRQPQARTTKAKSRIDRFFEVEKKAKRPISEGGVSFDLQMQRLGSKIIELHNVSKRFNKQVLFEGLDYKFKVRDRVGLIGRNGTGKSTLLNIIAGLEQPDTGKVVIGETVVLGYYTQDGLQIKEDKQVIEVIRDIADYIPMNGGKKLSASQLLERFLFDPKKQQTFVSKLSGGERRRLFLLTVLMKNPNVLILDEPTNDLDILTLQVLEEFLIEFPGCVIVVSHDRYFMDKIVEHVFVLDGQGGTRDYPGNYSAWREAAEREKAEASGLKATTASDKAPGDEALLREQRKELRKLEKLISQLQEKKLKITARFESGELSQDEIVKLSKELNELDQAIAEKEEAWLILAEETEA